MRTRTLRGELTPSSNTVLEPLTQAIVSDLEDVTAHFGRFRVTEISLNESALGQFNNRPIIEASKLLADADLVIWDQDRKVTINNNLLHHNVDYTPYEGMEIRGWPEITISRGEVIWADGEVKAGPGRGELLICQLPAAVRPRAH